MPLHNDILTARNGDENVPDFCGLVHFHDSEAVHGRVQRLEGVDLGDDDIGSHALCPHGDALSAPAVARDDDSFPGHDQIGGVHDRRPDRLSGPVLVVIIMLGFGVIDRHHGAGQDPLPLPCLKPQDPGGRLLAASDQGAGVLPAAPAQQIDQVAPVVHDQMWAAGQRLGQKVLVFLRGDSVFSKGLDPHAGDGRRHIILGGERIAACQKDLRPALFQDKTQICGLCLQVDRNGDAQPLEGLIFFKFLFDLRERRHEGAHPFNFLYARRRKSFVAYIAHIYVSPFSFLSHSGSSQVFFRCL